MKLNKTDETKLKISLIIVPASLLNISFKVFYLMKYILRVISLYHRFNLSVSRKNNSSLHCTKVSVELTLLIEKLLANWKISGRKGSHLSDSKQPKIPSFVKLCPVNPTSTLLIDSISFRR